MHSRNLKMKNSHVVMRAVIETMESRWMLSAVQATSTGVGEVTGFVLSDAQNLPASGQTVYIDLSCIENNNSGTNGV